MHCSGPASTAVTAPAGTCFYDAAHHRWTGYCVAAGVDIDIRQLGHASTETTQIYTLLTHKIADDEMPGVDHSRASPMLMGRFRAARKVEWRPGPPWLRPAPGTAPWCGRSPS